MINKTCTGGPGNKLKLKIFSSATLSNQKLLSERPKFSPPFSNRSTLSAILDLCSNFSHLSHDNQFPLFPTVSHDFVMGLRTAILCPVMLYIKSLTASEVSIFVNSMLKFCAVASAILENIFMMCGLHVILVGAYMPFHHQGIIKLKINASGCITYSRL